MVAIGAGERVSAPGGVSKRAVFSVSIDKDRLVYFISLSQVLKMACLSVAESGVNEEIGW